jgi:hypothetical protein
MPYAKMKMLERQKRREIVDFCILGSLKERSKSRCFVCSVGGASQVSFGESSG